MPSGRESEGAELSMSSLLGQHHCAAGFSPTHEPPRNEGEENGAAGGDSRRRQPSAERHRGRSHMAASDEVWKHTWKPWQPPDASHARLTKRY